MLIDNADVGSKSLVIALALVACTKRNPDYCENSAECSNGTVCTSHQCVLESDGGLDGGVDSRTADAPMACVPELLFQRGGLFGGEIYRIDLVSFVEHPVSNGIDSDIYASWSPDGSRIALTRNGNSIWTVDPDGTNGHQVDTQNGNFLLGAAWSPDGMRVAYMSTPTSGGIYDIYSAAVAGSSGTNLMPGQHGESPEFSPDGQKIAFSSNRTGNYDVFTMTASGANQTNLTQRVGNDGATGAHWSPDGTRILFTGQNHIWRIDSAGTNLTNLTGTTGSEDQARWSDDGSMIYYVSSPSSAAQLFVMSVAGVNQHPIETNPATDLEPVPSPDGGMVAWSSSRDGNSEIYVSNSDGSNPTRLTNNGASDHSPRWRPCR